MRIIQGEARGRRLRVPREASVRPALDQLRESVFAIIGDRVEDSRVLDLFAGSGAFGIEAISRGARWVTFVENDPPAIQVLELNLQGLGFAGRGQISRVDALQGPAGDERFDLIFVDPPFVLCRTREAARGVLSRVEELISRSLESGGVLLLRHPTSHPLVTRSRPTDRRTYGASTVIFFENP